MDRAAQHKEELQFEQDVLRVARSLWAKELPFQGSVLLSGSERDGVFVGPDMVAIVEATVSLRLDKAQKDGAKLKEAQAEYSRRHPLKAVKCYFVTRDEPTVEQRQHIERLGPGLVACSFAQLRSLLIDSREYLTIRDRYPFGSARDPLTGNEQDPDRYIEMGLIDSANASEKPYVASAIADRVSAGQSIVLLGEFGAGKSMTVREIHRALADAHRLDAGRPFPVTLNLRDHQGQRNPDEALRRHAETIGFAEATQLVRAWRAGEVHLLLDGFDEIATSGWLGQAPNLRHVRRRSVELVRKFVDQSPPSTGMFITGRRHLFDSIDEMLAAFGLALEKPLILSTDEFTEDQVNKYLQQRGWSVALPDWIPPRPLLLGYLAAAGIIDKFVDSKVPLGPSEGWDVLLDRICDRESKIELGLDGVTVRRVLERLATVARTRGNGLGPLRSTDLAAAFQQVCGYPPDEGSYVIIQRMPGLGVLDPVDGTRYFVDAALSDAASAGDLVACVASGGQSGSYSQLGEVARPMGQVGLGVAQLLCERTGLLVGQSIAAALRLNSGNGNSGFVLDCLRLGLLLGTPNKIPTLSIQAVAIDRLDLNEIEVGLSEVVFQDCLIDEIDLSEHDADLELPLFVGCVIGSVLGAGSPDALPLGRFIDCSFESFDLSTKTTHGILAMPGLSDRQKVTLTVLKKVYMQAGAGRRANSLNRGLNPHQRTLVGDALNSLTSAGLLVSGSSGGYTIYSSVRGQGKRVRAMLEEGPTSTDQVLVHVR